MTDSNSSSFEREYSAEFRASVAERLKSELGYQPSEDQINAELMKEIDPEQAFVNSQPW